MLQSPNVCERAEIDRGGCALYQIGCELHLFYLLGAYANACMVGENHACIQNGCAFFTVCVPVYAWWQWTANVVFYVRISVSFGVLSPLFVCKCVHVYIRFSFAGSPRGNDNGTSAKVMRMP